MSITEHFEQAKKDGHEWADKAIQYRKCHLYNQDDEPNMGVEKLSTAIGTGFVWGKTKEGREFWKKIYEEVESRE
jgi:hypothetical protein